MAGFSHDLASGNGDLKVATFQSPNFNAGDTGWQVTQDGQAEFNGATFRGSVQGSEFVGDDFIMNAAGIFFYASS